MAQIVFQMKNVFLVEGTMIMELVMVSFLYFFSFKNLNWNQ